jgi:hypothetical protein
MQRVRSRLQQGDIATASRQVWCRLSGAKRRPEAGGKDSSKGKWYYVWRQRCGERKSAAWGICGSWLFVWGSCGYLLLVTVCSYGMLYCP